MEKLERLYDLVIYNMQITTAKLLSIGFFQEEIDNLIDDGILRISGKEYFFCDINSLYKYGEKLVVSFNYKKANKCFSACLRINPTHRKAVLQKLFQCLKADYIPGILELFEKLLTIEPEKYIVDNNVYTYLLSQLDYTPVTYTRVVDRHDLKSNDGATFDELDSRLVFVRNKISDNRLLLAMTVLNDVLAQNKIYSIELNILKELMSKAIVNNRNQHMVILDMIESESYSNILNYLEEIKQRRNLDCYEFYILEAVKKFVEVLQTKEIPDILDDNPQNILDALKGNNFEVAIILDKRFLKNNNINESDDILLMVLKALCKTINKIREESLNVGNCERCMLYEEKYSPAFIDQSLYTEELIRMLNDILFIMREKCMNLEEVIKEYNLNQEEQVIFKALMAKECYELGFIYLGSKYLEEVKSIDNLPAIVLEIIDDIQQIQESVTRKLTIS